jgi:8-oxo-dGTP pyrophosphatase MutT (NUDIX family)
VIRQKRDVPADEGSGMIHGVPKIREGAAAILISTDGRLLLQQRDDLPHVSDPGKIGLFGGRREGDESFLECVVREVHEEIGIYLPPQRFDLIGRYFGPDHLTPDGIRHSEVFIAYDVPIDQLQVTEGILTIVAMDELKHIRNLLAPFTKYALEMFLEREQTAT